MEKLSKQFEEWVTKLKNDEFFLARLKLTLFYSLTAFIILLIASFILYKSLLLNIRNSFEDSALSPATINIIINRTKDALQNLFIFGNGAIMLFVIVAGFLLTNKTLAPIKRSMQQQKRFIADASHELRTPITIAISGLEVALRNRDIHSSVAKDALSKTLKELQDLSKLTNHMLDVTRSNLNSKNEKEPVQMNEVIHEVASKMKGEIEKKGIELVNNVKFKATIMGNKVELGRVIYNILNNAITHTRGGGKITLYDTISNKDYVIRVADTGVGISKENMQKIFDPFYQGDISRNSGGAGLGLTLAKQIVENHGGTISIRSELGKWTVVIISVPMV